MLSGFLVYIGYLFWSKISLNVFFVCLLLGGLGNILPRFVYGSVWDYLHLSFLGLWFNLSDVLILISVLSYILMDDESTYSF